MTSPARCFGCGTNVIDPIRDWVRKEEDSRYVYFLCADCKTYHPAIGWDGPFPFVASWKQDAA